MPYWEVAPHENTDYDSALFPAETEDNHRAALDYAKERLESLWDSAIAGGGAQTVSITLHKGDMPDFEVE
jgi:hypothetical protein